jgi:hypothetical protein
MMALLTVLPNRTPSEIPRTVMRINTLVEGPGPKVFVLVEVEAA